MCSSSESGQATVEAALLIPIAFLLVALMLQPAIVLYDRMVMQAAAGQALRMLATKPSAYGYDGYVRAIEDQLRAVPDIPMFRCGDWDIELSGDESSDEVRVLISTELRPLPLVSLPAHFLASPAPGGNLMVTVEAQALVQPAWAWSSGLGPSEWPGQWE